MTENKKIVIIYVAEADEINLGVGFLSAALKAQDWDVRLFVWHIRPGFQESLDDILNFIRQTDPFSICLSVMTLHWNSILTLLERIDEAFDGPILVGGYHAIVSPESVLSHNKVTAVCIGDGELPVINFLEAASAQRDAYGIPGLWGKKNRFFSSDWRGQHWFVPQLEQYPFIDYDLFHQAKPLTERQNIFFSPTKQTMPALPVVSGRGCPFHCTYCTNPVRMDKFPSPKEYLRKYPPELLVEYIQRAVDKFHVTFLDIQDELFIHNKDWIKKFAESYKKSLRLPFLAHIHLDFVTEEICEILTDCGWMLATFGVECGDETYRKQYLKRMMSNEQIETKVALLKKYNLLTVSFNMMGMPLENINTLEATINLNKKIQPDIAMCLYWQPLPGTELTSIAVKEGWISHADSITITNFGTRSFTTENEDDIRRLYTQFNEESFSLTKGAPDRLMQKLSERSRAWIASNTRYQKYL